MRERQGLALFFLVAFGASWAGWTALAVLEPKDPRIDWALRYMSGDFCSLAGIIATCWAAGRAGLRDLVRRTVAVPRSPGWWLYALGLPLVWGVATIAVYAPGHGGFGNVRLEKIVRLFSPTYLFWFVTGPLGEEFGWRGYLLPALQRRWSPFWSSVAIGVLWGVWHLPLYYDSVFATLPGALGFTYYTVCLSLVITVLVNRTRGSVAMAILLHWSSNLIPYALREMFPDVQQEGTDYVMIGRVSLTVVAAVAVAAGGRAFFRPPPVVPSGTPTGPVQRSRSGGEGGQALA